ncbi:hypothetical protein [Aliiglaciecola sp. LCG003]|uniref:tetratricopeptide repeat protein n=1 Tax=Aliiglaciecola sp. LCG003 TaxID=3053655 RepID=UPI002574755E|nr:hypothetical protein [Aliiglaciecola sp. LCG003]WJG10896.1 hypothetical protein QR722_07675 [Aliiglaciecola sp. LCG003]
MIIHPTILAIGACALLLFLHSDHCHNSQRIKRNLANENSILPQLYLLAKQGEQGALLGLTQAAMAQNSQHWLRLAANLGEPNALFELAQLAPSQDSRQVLLERAARLGHPQSSYQLGVLHSNPQVALRHYENAARGGDPRGIVALYNLLVALNRQEDALLWLQQAASWDESAAINYAQSLWLNNDINASVQVLRAAQSKGFGRAQKLLEQVPAISAEAVSQVLANNKQPSCQIKIQFVASSLLALQNIHQLKSEFSQDTRFQGFPICFNAVIAVTPERLQCSDDLSARLQCNLAPLIEQARAADFTHAIVIGEHGKANVHNGVMYLDRQDSYQVFVHELAHFAGFVDEYSLTESLAKSFCQGEAAPNLVFDDARPLWSATHFAAYKSFQPNMALIETDTCSSTKRRAFKPVSQTTFMEHHDLGNIPSLYLKIWLDVLNSPEKLTPIYVNFAQYYEMMGEQDKADTWWQKYADFQS